MRVCFPSYIFYLALQLTKYLPKKRNQRTYSDDEVDHEENVEGQVNLLRDVAAPRLASLHSLSGTQINTILAQLC